MSRTIGLAARWWPVLAVLWLTSAPRCDAQGAARTPPMLLRPSFRADAILGRDPGAQVAVGVGLAGAYNVRLSLDAGAGGVERRGGWASTGRIDLMARWLSDPFRQSRWGINAGGGIGQRVEATRAPVTIAIVTIGVEGPSDGTWVPGVELGLGGGVRAGVTLRRAPVHQR